MRCLSKIKSVLTAVLYFLCFATLFSTFLKTTNPQFAIAEAEEANIEYALIFKDRTFNLTYKYIPSRIQNCGNLTLAVVVLSRPENGLHREAIRETWASKNSSYSLKSHTAKVFFIVGTTSDTNVMKSVMDEVATKKDLIVISAEDTYHNLVIKALTILHFNKNYCSAPYIAKVDDDVVFHIVRLMHLIHRGILTNQKPTFYGKAWKSSEPVRNKSDKWYVSYGQFIGLKYPPFCGGPAYIANHKAAVKTIDGLGRFEFLHLEDVFITGIMAEKNGIERISMRKSFAFKPYIGMYGKKVKCDSDRIPYLLAVHGWPNHTLIHIGWKKLRTIKCRIITNKW